MSTTLDVLGRMHLPGRIWDDVAERLRKGAEEYGDASFERPRVELLREIREEALDVIGWACVLTARDGQPWPSIVLESAVAHAVTIARCIDLELDGEPT